MFQYGATIGNAAEQPPHSAVARPTSQLVWPQSGQRVSTPGRYIRTDGAGSARSGLAMMQYLSYAGSTCDESVWLRDESSISVHNFFTEPCTRCAGETGAVYLATSIR